MLSPTSTMSGQSMLYSPTPMKRRTTSEHMRKSTRRSSDTMSGAVAKDVREAMKNNSDSPNFSMSNKEFDDCSKRSNQDSLSSKMGSTVPMEESESDSDESFFADNASQIPKSLGSESPKEFNDSPTKKRDKSKKKKKKGNSDKKKKKKNKSEKPKKKREKSEKSRRKRDQSEESTAKSPKDGNSKGPSLFDALQVQNSAGPSQSDSDQESGFSGEAFQGSHYVVPQIQQQEEVQELPYGPPLWGDTEEENSFGDVWEEDQSWNGWDEERADDDKSEYAEETLCDDVSHDGFSYYTVQSNDDLGFPEEDDIDIDEYSTSWDEKPASTTKSTKSVCFNDCETVHNTLHICDFTKKEISRCWYQQKDYEETIQGVRDVASSSETPRDTQTRLRRQRSLLSKSAETRGLEAWTPSGVQRFRYVKEAAFRAVWDEQQKQLDRSEQEGDDNSVDISENAEILRHAYQRVSMKSQREAEKRAKQDADIAEKLRPRKGSLQRGRRGDLSRFKKSMGTSGRKLLDDVPSNDLSDSPAAPPSCLRKSQDPIDETLSPSIEEANKRVWFGDSPRNLARRGLFKQSSDRSLLKQKSGRGLFKQSSDRSLFKKKSDGGLFKQSSDRSLFKKKSDRGLFKQPSDLSLFKKQPEFDPISEEYEEPSDHLEKPKANRRSSFEFGMFTSMRNMRKTFGDSERLSRSINEDVDLDHSSEHVRAIPPSRGLSRQNSEPVIGQKNSLVCQ